MRGLFFGLIGTGILLVTLWAMLPDAIPLAAKYACLALGLAFVGASFIPVGKGINQWRTKRRTAQEVLLANKMERRKSISMELTRIAAAVRVFANLASGTKTADLPTKYQEQYKGRIKRYYAAAKELGLEDAELERTCEQPTTIEDLNLISSRLANLARKLAKQALPR